MRTLQNGAPLAPGNPADGITKFRILCESDQPTGRITTLMQIGADPADKDGLVAAGWLPGEELTLKTRISGSPLLGSYVSFWPLLVDMTSGNHGVAVDAVWLAQHSPPRLSSRACRGSRSSVSSCSGGISAARKGWLARRLPPVRRRGGLARQRSRSRASVWRSTRKRRSAFAQGRSVCASVTGTRRAMPASRSARCSIPRAATRSTWRAAAPSRSRHPSTNTEDPGGAPVPHQSSHLRNRHRGRGRSRRRHNRPGPGAGLSRRAPPAGAHRIWRERGHRGRHCRTRLHGARLRRYARYYENRRPDRCHAAAHQPPGGGSLRDNRHQ